jgi:hypothetical protein
MNERRILEELLALLETNNVTVRHEAMGGRGGGLCNIKGRNFFFVDSQATSIDSAALCARSIAKLIDVEKVYIKPQIRQFIENCDKVEKQ